MVRLYQLNCINIALKLNVLISHINEYYFYPVFEILGNAALQQFVEIKSEDTASTKDTMESIAISKAKVYEPLL